VFFSTFLFLFLPRSFLCASLIGRASSKGPNDAGLPNFEGSNDAILSNDRKRPNEAFSPNLPPPVSDSG
jgi:hypothetical protein